MPALYATRRLPRSLDWAEAAVCVDEAVPPKEFDRSTVGAKEACERCPVVDECLEHLLSWDVQVGWGAGMSEAQRQKMANRRGRFLRVDRGTREIVSKVG